MGKAVVELGHKKVGMIWTQKGNISATEIWEGVKRELDAGGVEVVAEAWDAGSFLHHIFATTTTIKRGFASAASSAHKGHSR